MRPSILIVMLDFLVCSLLMFVVGTGGKQSQFATAAAPGVHEEFTPAALQAQQDEWNRDYEQQSLLAKLQTETSEKEQLRSQLTETSATLAAREANVRALAEQKAQLEQAKSQTEQALQSVGQQLTHVQTEREKLQKEGDAAKESLAKLATEQTKLQQEKEDLSKRAAQLGETVASQQSTISTLSEEVRASQARVETQLTDVASGQAAMGASLAQLDEFTRTLPALIQTNVASFHDDQRVMQDNLAALAANVKEMQTSLDPAERARLTAAMTDVSRGQKELQAQLDALLKAGQGDQYGANFSALQSGQDALLEKTAKLSDQIESIKARGPGPFKAVRNARLELLTSITARDARDNTVAHFRAAAYPPVVRVAGQSYVVTTGQTLGLGWHGLDTSYQITALTHTIRRAGDATGTGPLNSSACVLRADARVAAVPILSPVTGLETMELAAADTTPLNLHIFKSTTAGLSFEADTTPDMSDPRFLVIKRALRGVAAWFENPAYRADAGDYVVTADGKFVGIMVTRERCLIITPALLADCARTVPLTDPSQFQQAARR